MQTDKLAVTFSNPHLKSNRSMMLLSQSRRGLLFDTLFMALGCMDSTPELSHKTRVQLTFLISSS